MERPNASEDLEEDHNGESGLVIALTQLTHMEDDVSCMTGYGTLGISLQWHRHTVLSDATKTGTPNTNK